jgi:hypothetical protein
MNLVGVPGYQTYNDGIHGWRYTALAPASYNLFKATMNSMRLNFTYDYAVAIME